MSVLSFTKHPDPSYQALEPLSPWPTRQAAGRHWLWRIGWRVARWCVLAVLESRVRRAARDLQRLDDRMLRDIGLSRCEIDHAARYGRAGELGPFAAERAYWSSNWPDQQ